MIRIGDFEGVFQSTVLPAAEIPFSEAVRKACEANVCGRYGKSWTCPPGVGETALWQEKFSTYRNALVFTHKGNLEDSFDYEGMQRVAAETDLILNAVIDAMKKDGTPFLPLGHGSCTLCETCTYPDAPCRLPDKVIVSIEACGVNVVELAAKCKINYHNGANTVTYFCIILY